jgi:hypothetical protein
MDENNRTNTEILAKGLKQMGVCLILMFAGPSLLHLSLDNKDKPLYIPLLIVSIILCILAISLLFIGINTIMNSIFKKK